MKLFILTSGLDLQKQLSGAGCLIMEMRLEFGLMGCRQAERNLVEDALFRGALPWLKR